MMLRKVFTITGTSKASSGQALVGSALAGLDKYDYFMVDALLVGATGGTLDLYVQRKLDTDVWLDWIHFPQLAGGASAIYYSASCQPGNGLTVVGKTADNGTTGAPALAANTIVGGHPGDQIRLVCVAGGGTSVGAAVTVYVSAFNQLG